MKFGVICPFICIAYICVFPANKEHGISIHSKNFPRFSPSHIPDNAERDNGLRTITIHRFGLREETGLCAPEGQRSASPSPLPFWENFYLKVRERAGEHVGLPVHKG